MQKQAKKKKSRKENLSKHSLSFTPNPRYQTAKNIEVLEDIAVENLTPLHKNNIAEEYASPIIPKLLEDFIDKYS